MNHCQIMCNTNYVIQTIKCIDDMINQSITHNKNLNHNIIVSKQAQLYTNNHYKLYY